MKTKWYLGILTVILVLSGLRDQQTQPNQEIVLQFTSELIALDKVKGVIAEVESQLQNLGATNIQIGEAENGILKIVYYSHFDIESIKNKLSKKEDDLQLSYTNNDRNNHSESPSKQSSNDYDFDVFEIQNNYDIKSDIEGYLLDHKSEADLTISSNDNASCNKFTIQIKNDADALAYHSYKNVILALDRISNKIPEVRAGPAS